MTFVVVVVLNRSTFVSIKSPRQSICASWHKQDVALINFLSCWRVGRRHKSKWNVFLSLIGVRELSPIAATLTNRELSEARKKPYAGCSPFVQPHLDSWTWLFMRQTALFQKTSSAVTVGCRVWQNCFSWVTDDLFRNSANLFSWVVVVSIWKLFALLIVAARWSLHKFIYCKTKSVE